MADTKLSRKILIVDDSLLSRKTAVNALKQSQHKVVEASSGKDALELIQQEKPDFVLLDILMPDMDGFEVLEKINQMENKPMVIMISADIQESTKTKCIKLGAAAYLNKPVNSSDLLAVIDSAAR